jgi:hypothetical protein
LQEQQSFQWLAESARPHDSGRFRLERTAMAWRWSHDHLREQSMLAALRFLGQITDQLFERQMRRAALKISARQQLFPRR